MNGFPRWIRVTTAGCIVLALACNRQSSDSGGRSATNAKPSSASNTGHARNDAPSSPSTPARSPHGDPHSGLMASPHGTPAGATMTGNTLNLEGLTMTVPEGWRKGEIAPGPFAPVAVFEIAGADAEHGQVRITHYPNMKGMDDMNLNRWLGQVTKNDGSSYSMEEANLSVTESGNVRIKMIDVSGNVMATMRDTPRPNNRMIAAIVDHPKGPHFVVASGGAATIDQAVGAIKAFIASAAVK